MEIKMPITIGEPIEINGKVYLVKKLLGEGGHSRVYMAVEKDTKQKVAIKDFTYNAFFDKYNRTNDCIDYWENEVLNTQAQARSGQHCVEVLNYEAKMDLQTPELYIVLSLIEGTTFQDWYRKFVLMSKGLENLDLSSVVRNIFIPLAKLLDYCHNKEYIVHRDFSVRNIIVQSNDIHFWPVLIDWGISKYIGEDWVNYCPKPYMTEDMPKDIPIKQKGAPPEIRNGYMPVPASDIYYLGHLMYFVFTGGIMREDSELISKEDYVLEPKNANHLLPDQYNKVVKKLTQFEPADRPSSMGEVLKMLRDLIKINQIHFDFEVFFEQDTNELTGIVEQKGDNKIDQRYANSSETQSSNTESGNVHVKENIGSVQNTQLSMTEDPSKKQIPERYENTIPGENKMDVPVQDKKDFPPPSSKTPDPIPVQDKQKISKSNEKSDKNQEKSEDKDDFVDKSLSKADEEEIESQQKLQKKKELENNEKLEDENDNDSTKPYKRPAPI